MISNGWEEYFNQCWAQNDETSIPKQPTNATIFSQTSFIYIPYLYLILQRTLHGVVSAQLRTLCLVCSQALNSCRLFVLLQLPIESPGKNERQNRIQ